MNERGRDAVREAASGPTLPVPRVVRAWLVDLDGTLYRLAPARIAAGLALLTREPSAWRVLQRFRQEHQAVREHDGALTEPSPFDEQLARTAAALGATPEEVRQKVERWMLHEPARWLRYFRRETLIAELLAFRAAGGHAALVSDYPATVKLAGLRLEGAFDVVVASGEPQGPARLKPDPAGYLLAAERLGVAPADCLVVGDRPELDGLAAARAGMAFRRVP